MLHYPFTAKHTRREGRIINIELIKNESQSIAVVESDDLIIKDAGSALDFVMSVQYETKSNRIALNKDAIAEEFFILSTGLAGEVLQKFINYHIKFAIYGDFSKYTSKPLKDFIYESNHGTTTFFVASKEEAVSKLAL